MQEGTIKASIGTNENNIYKSSHYSKCNALRERLDCKSPLADTIINFCGMIKSEDRPSMMAKGSIVA